MSAELIPPSNDGNDLPAPLPARVFVVEDETLVALAISDRLQRLGYVVCGLAARGEDALQLIPRAAASLVLMDIHLAGELDGIQAARRLQAVLDVPVVFLTAYGDSEMLRRAMAVGSFAYLAKPFQDLDLHAAIQFAVQRHGLQRALREANAALDAKVRQRTRALEAANAALRERERRYRMLFEGSQDGIVVVDRETRDVIDCNDAFCRLAGWERPELVGLPEPPLTAEEGATGLSGLAVADQPEPSAVVEARLATRLGTVVDVEIKATALTIDDRAAVLGVFRDVTARKAAELALRTLNGELALLVRARTAEVRTAEDALARSHLRYMELVETIHDGVIRDDRDGRLEYANRQFREWFGIEGRDVREVTIADYVAPEARADVIERHRRRVAGESVLDHYEFEAVRPDGSRLWLEALVAPVVEQDRIVGTQSVIRDVTDRKRKDLERERLLAAIEQSGEAVIITDAAGRIEYVNRAFETITGYSSAEAIGRRPSLVKSGRHDRAFYHDLWTTITRGGVWTGHIVNRRKDGVLYTEATTISPVVDGAGRIVNYVAAKRDITRQLELEQQFLQSQKLESIGRLAGGVAHDFNNLLTVITGSAEELLRAAAPQDPARDAIAAILAAGDRAASLTRQLLAFSRRQVLQPTLLDVNDVVTDMRPMLERLIPEDVDLVVTLSPEPVLARADRHQLQQVLMNLAVNARDAMPAGGRIVIETARASWRGPSGTDEPSAASQMAVSDTGAGMDEATRSRIFEPFFTTKEAGRGTGLGLSVVQGIVAQSGGRVEVTSEPGVGTTFRVLLPIASGQAQAATSSTPAPAPAGSGTVLVVEDQQELRTFVARALEAQGYEVLTAATALDALAVFDRDPGRIALLLTDVVMPGLSGPQLAEQVWARRAGLPVVFMSGYADIEASGPTPAAATARSIQKPFTVRELAAAVHAALAN